jgi:hypothetical protein
MAEKVKKVDQAIEIYRQHLPTKEVTPKRQWRKEVLDDYRIKLGLTNYGTLSDYFATADQVVSGREVKMYNRVDTRQELPFEEREAEALKLTKLTLLVFHHAAKYNLCRKQMEDNFQVLIRIRPGEFNDHCHHLTCYPVVADIRYPETVPCYSVELVVGS